MSCNLCLLLGSLEITASVHEYVCSTLAACILPDGRLSWPPRALHRRRYAIN